jgi:hypothetical protein
MLENENVEIKMKKMEQKFTSMQIVKIIEKLGNEKVSQAIRAFFFVIHLFAIVVLTILFTISFCIYVIL